MIFILCSTVHDENVISLFQHILQGNISRELTSVENSALGTQNLDIQSGTIPVDYTMPVRSNKKPDSSISMNTIKLVRASEFERKDYL